MKRLALAAPLLIAAVIAGCGSSSSSSSVAKSTKSSSGTPVASSSGGGGGTVTLSESEFKITPATPSVTHTGAITITVKNVGAVTHALTVQTPAGPVSTGSIAPGKTATLKVDASKPGKYKFFCPIPGHAKAGMTGTLAVS